MQDACHNELGKYDHARHESPSSSVVRASDRCYGRSWFRFPSGIQNFSFSHARDKLNIPSFSFLSELKIYHLSFFIITHGAFDIADPNSMQDECHNELSKYDLARHESPSSSVVRTPDRFYGRSWVRFPSGSQNFSLSYARDKVNTPSFSRIKMLINSFSQDLIYATSVAKANLLNTFCCRMG